MTRLIFFFSLFMLFYIYCGYPLVVLLLAKVRPRPVHKGPYQPNITILISAYNEERHIEDTIKNKLAMNYPKDKMEIIVISDGSIDKTDEIVRKFENDGVRLLRQEPRAGKTAALNSGVRSAKGEILVFSDANSIYDQHVLSYLVRNFYDPEVGYVTGRMIYTNLDGTIIGDGCSAYMKYENMLRRYETTMSSIVGVDGGIDAARKSLYHPMNPDQLPDFVLPLRVIEQGYRVVYEPQALLKEPSLTSAHSEYTMRVRVSLRALWALWDMRHLLNFARYKLFAWELFSHKLLRYFGFVFLTVLYLGNIFLLGDSLFYNVFFMLQNVFYLSASLSFIFEKLGSRIGLFYLSYYFTVLNLASAHAFFRFALGRKQVIWTPRT